MEICCRRAREFDDLSQIGTSFENISMEKPNPGMSFLLQFSVVLGLISDKNVTFVA